MIPSSNVVTRGIPRAGKWQWRGAFNLKSSGKPAFDKLDSIKQHFFHFLLSSALNYDVDSSFSSWLPSSRVGWYSFPRRAIRILRKIHLHFIRCGACCFLRGICVLRRCSILSVASRSWLVKRSRSDPKHVTVVCWNFARRSGVDLPRETVQSFPLYMHYSHPHARWALPHRDFDRSFGGRVRRFNDRCHFPVDLSILVSTKPRFAPTSVPVYTIYWSRKKNAIIYYRIRGEYVAVSKLQLYIHGMSRTDCTCTVSNVPKTRDPSAIGQQSSLVTDLAQIHRLTLCIITVASSSEDGPGTIRNFEKLFPLFWKKRQENTGLLPGTKITMSIKPHLREIQGEKKWSDARGVFLEVARREGNTKSVRKAIVRSSAWNPSRGEKKKLHERTNRRRSSTFDACYRIEDWSIDATTEPEFTLRVPIYSRRWHETVEEDRSTRRGAARDGNATLETEERFVGKKFDPPSIDRSRIFFFFYDHATT